MGQVLLFSEVLGVETVSALILLSLLFAAFFALQIIRHWDLASSSERQYQLEERNFLISLIMKVSFYIKLILFPYFFYVLQMLSDHLPGAMCAAGVVNANSFGASSIFLKLLVLFVAAFWLVLDHFDLNSESYPLTVKKQKLLLLFLLLAILEVACSYLFFYEIDLNMVVQCCSIIYGSAGGVVQGPFQLLAFEYPLYFFLILSISIIVERYRRDYLTVVFNLLFLFISFLAIVHFYGPYIYQLPNHLCPYCLLQSPYYYVGYPIFGLLLFSSFLPMVKSFGRILFSTTFLAQKNYSVWMKCLLFTILNLYPIFYFLTNGVLLFPLK